MQFTKNKNSTENLHYTVDGKKFKKENTLFKHSER